MGGAFQHEPIQIKSTGAVAFTAYVNQAFFFIRQPPPPPSLSFSPSPPGLPSFLLSVPGAIMQCARRRARSLICRERGQPITNSGGIRSTAAYQSEPGAEADTIVIRRGSPIVCAVALCPNACLSSPSVLVSLGACNPVSLSLSLLTLYVSAAQGLQISALASRWFEDGLLVNCHQPTITLLHRIILSSFTLLPYATLTLLSVCQRVAPFTNTTVTSP